MSIFERLRDLRSVLSQYSNAALVAVSKTHSIESVMEAYEAGQRDFGENYVQELLEKATLARARGISDIRWHFIGHLQTNKVKALMPVVSTLHAIGSMRLAQEVSKRWIESGRSGRLPVFLEVNIDQEESKGGFRPDELVSVLPSMAALPGLDWRGLMCIPSPEGGRSGTSFRRLVQLERQCRPITAGELSMGMSGDFEMALREGVAASKVWIRIGTGIFGERAPRG